MKPHRPRIGLALGSGSARGWSHIGVIRVLEQAGIRPDIVCGTSIGAMVGAAYAAGEMERFESWVSQLSWQGVVGFLDLKMGGGLMAGGKLVEFFRSRFDDQGIELLPKAFGCVATDLSSGREIWLREGSVVDSVRASIALPGIFTPSLCDGRLLVDGGLVNPVPVSLCRAMGADIVIAVDLNWDLVGRRYRVPNASQAEAVPAGNGLVDSFLSRFRPARPAADAAGAAPAAPSMLEVLATSLNIMQVRITQSRLAGEPADVLIRPRLSDIAITDFHRSAVSIAEGVRAAEHALPMIREMLD
ncbi:patatin-like phospholipase family protein [Uliginosibacterium sp. 31-16]|uniref:patatin-like phospholipase family protein n=1 Tax=Uliginosibacterium sp. 31-16 TaxID=3068315 RepID=UPI00273E7528|nr:patatin-like phospholipase family protein [Uliginosibacterium sp. 31-16]MDP5239842.1 patatin-like phospholipase family protein [Uliginosibacterium sp. 31-16]